MASNVRAVSAGNSSLSTTALWMRRPASRSASGPGRTETIEINSFL
ncbi:hypothetical protein ACGFYQ_40150 [Streptomyces sp. NPDC048258]